MYRHGKTAVFILSIMCAFLVGVILGYFLHGYLRVQRVHSYYEPVTENIEYDYLATPFRQDIIYYQPHGDKIWSSQLEEIPSGHGSIMGYVYIDDEPAESLEIALLLAPGRKTQTTITDQDGKFVISIKKDNYYFNGIAIYNPVSNLTDRLLVNKVASYDIDNLGCILNEANAHIEEFEKLSEKYGPEEASQRIAEQLQSLSELYGKCPLLVKDEVITLPAFRYRKPIKIISPSYNAHIVLEKLKFVWESIPDAQSYKISIDYVEKKGATTSYHTIMVCKGVKENYISYDDLVQRNEYTEMYAAQSLRPENTYGVQIIAYDNEGNVVTASGERITDLSFFHTK